MSTMREHDREARERFEVLWRAHHGAVLAFAARRVGETDAHDVAEDTFLTAWRRRDQAISNERAWLLGVARKVIATRRRSETRLDALEHELGVLAPPHGGAPTGEPPVILEALARLSAKDQEALTLVYWDGLSHAEAAEVVGIPKPLFATRLSRGRRRLRRHMTDLDAGPAAKPRVSNATPQPATGGDDS